MKERIVTIGFNHDYEVRNMVAELQEKGNEVTDIKRISKMFLFFGYDITEITYKKGQ